jgi:hypothetical protein
VIVSTWYAHRIKADEVLKSNEHLPEDGFDFTDSRYISFLILNIFSI